MSIFLFSSILCKQVYFHNKQGILNIFQGLMYHKSFGICCFLYLPVMFGEKKNLGFCLANFLPSQTIELFQNIIDGCVLFLSFALANKSRSSAKNICEKLGPSLDALNSSHYFPSHFLFIKPPRNSMHKMKMQGQIGSPYLMPLDPI